MAKVITMITGELGFESIFSLSYDVEDPKTTTPVINFPIAYIVWVAFLILIPISLANMLVSDNYNVHNPLLLLCPSCVSDWSSCW